MVEASTSRAGYVGDHAIHHLPALLVGIEVLVNKMPKKASALRDCYRINALYRRCCLRIVFQKREKIAHRCQPNFHDCWVLRGVDQLVNLARNKAAIEMKVMRIGSELPIDHVRKAPII